MRNDGRALTDLMLNLQAQIIAFSRDYRLAMIVTLCAIPLTLMIGSTSPRCASRRWFRSMRRWNKIRKPKEKERRVGDAALFTQSF